MVVYTQCHISWTLAYKPLSTRDSLLFLKSNRLYFHSQGGSTVGNMVIVERTSVFDFLSRVSIVTRYIDIANLSVRPSVRPSVRDIPVSYENGLT